VFRFSPFTKRMPQRLHGRRRKSSASCNHSRRAQQQISEMPVRPYFAGVRAPAATSGVSTVRQFELVRQQSANVSGLAPAPFNDSRVFDPVRPCFDADRNPTSAAAEVEFPTNLPGFAVFPSCASASTGGLGRTPTARPTDFGLRPQGRQLERAAIRPVG